MSNGIETWCGAPEVFRAPRRPNTQQAAGAAPAGAQQRPAGGAGAPPAGAGAPPAGMGQQQPQQTYTEEEYLAFEKQQADSEAALSEWRKNAPLEKFAELAQKFRDAGVDIHIVKWSPARWSDDDIDYAFKVTQAMGVNAITEELGEEAVKKLAPFAEK